MNGLHTTTIVGRFPQHVHHDIVVRSYPKAIFLYPTFVATIAMALLMHFQPEHGVTGTLVFLGILFANMGVLAIDFPVVWTLLLFLAAALAGTVGFLVDAHLVEFLPWAISLGRNLQPMANEHFYGTMAAGMALIFVLVFAISRFSYFRITPQGIDRYVFGNTTSMGKAGQTTQCEITDVFEWLLLGSGRIVIHMRDEPDIVLENVPRVLRVNRRIQTLGEATPVRLDDPFAGSNAHRP